jgi:hypothetical protein
MKMKITKTKNKIKNFILSLQLANYKLFFHLFSEYNTTKLFEIIVSFFELLQLISLPLGSEV